MATKVDKKINVDEFELVKFQLLTHCFVEKLRLTETELNVMALLGTQKQIRLTHFCRLVVEKEFLGSEISVNNCLSKLERTEIFLKKGVGKKIICLNPILNIVHEGTVILDVRLIKRDDTQKVA